jgi:large exoprotein involved in heme utilization and adhesion
MNDITASSQFGISGTISSCSAAEGNFFTMTGHGGLPEDPIAFISSMTTQILWEDLREISSPLQQARIFPDSLPSANAEFPQQPIEATGWQVNETGQIELVAALTGETQKSLEVPASSCHQTRTVNYLE